MLYNKPDLEIYIFGDAAVNDLKKAAQIYEKKTGKKYKNLYDAGYAILFEKVNELLKESEKHD